MCHSSTSSANAETWWPTNLPRWFGNGFVNLQRHFNKSTGKYLHTNFQETKVELYKFLKKHDNYYRLHHMVPTASALNMAVVKQ